MGAVFSLAASDTSFVSVPDGIRLFGWLLAAVDDRLPFVGRFIRVVHCSGETRTRDIRWWWTGEAKIDLRHVVSRTFGIEIAIQCAIGGSARWRIDGESVRIWCIGCRIQLKGHLWNTDDAVSLSIRSHFDAFSKSWNRLSHILERTRHVLDSCHWRRCGRDIRSQLIEFPWICRIPLGIKLGHMGGRHGVFLDRRCPIGR